MISKISSSDTCNQSASAKGRNTKKTPGNRPPQYPDWLDNQQHRFSLYADHSPTEALHNKTLTKSDSSNQPQNTILPRNNVVIKDESMRFKTKQM